MMDCFHRTLDAGRGQAHKHHHVRWHHRGYLCPNVVLQGAPLQTCTTPRRTGRMPGAEVGHGAAPTKYPAACPGLGAGGCRSCGSHDQATPAMHRCRHALPPSATQSSVPDRLALDQQCRMRSQKGKPCTARTRNDTCSRTRRGHQRTTSWPGTHLCLCTGKVQQEHLQSAED